MILAGCALIGPMLLRDDLLGMPNFLYFFILVCTASGVLVSLSLKRSNEKE
jgi:ABC-type multidrug transport system permease subunit